MINIIGLSYIPLFIAIEYSQSVHSIVVPVKIPLVMLPPELQQNH